MPGCCWAPFTSPRPRPHSATTPGWKIYRPYIGVWQSWSGKTPPATSLCEAEGLLAAATLRLCPRSIPDWNTPIALASICSTPPCWRSARILAAIDAEDAHTTFMEALHRATEDGLELLRMRAMSGALRIRDDDKRADLAACCERLVGETVHLDDARAHSSSSQAAVVGARYRRAGLRDCAGAARRVRYRPGATCRSVDRARPGTTQ